MAEGAFKAAVTAAGLEDHFEIDSAGTIGYHAGAAPDPRAQEAAAKRSVDITGQKSRKVADADFDTYDYIMVMDRENLSDLRNRSEATHHDKIELFLTYAPDMPLDEMPDPYHGSKGQFDSCYAAAMDAADGLLAHIRAKRF
jgi:protein-tyrosine phosphatase